METQPIYTLGDISSETGVSTRRIRLWIEKRVVPEAVSRNADGINYTESHLRRVRMVRDWVESQITLPELAERIEILGEKALEVVDPYAGYDGWS